MNHNILRLAIAVGALVLVGRSDAQSQKPMLQVTAKSFEGLMKRATEITNLVMKGYAEVPEELKKNPLVVFDAATSLPGFDLTKPVGFRIMYKAPTGPVPIDGDILVLIPVADAAKFTDELLPKARFTNLKTENGLTSFSPPNTQIKAFGRNADGYFYATIADADVVSTGRLPKPNDFFGDVKHDLSLTLGFGSIPEATIRNGFKTLQAMNPAAAASASSEKSIQQFIDTDVVQIGVDVDSSAGKVLVDSSVSAKSGSALATTFKDSTPGPLKSSIGLSPSAVFSLSMRGAIVGQGSDLGEAVKLLKNAPPVVPKAVLNPVVELIEELAKAELEDMAISVSGDGTALLAAAVKSTSAFELKIGEVIDKVVPEIQKDAGDNADKVKDLSKKDAVTIGGVKLSRIWIPLNKKSRDWGFSIYLGVKENVAFVAVTILDSTETIENALKQKVIEDHDPLTMTLKLKELAEAFLVLDYKGSAAVKMESKGGNPFKMTMEIPVKDMAELSKLGLAAKIKQRFGGAKPTNADDDG